MPGTATCGPFGESGTYTRPPARRFRARAARSARSSRLTYQKTIGNSNYNALEVNLRHQQPVRWNCWLGYTYGKSLDQSSSLAEAVNPLNPR